MATASAALMSQDESASEKSTLVGLAAHEDARALVRLIQCKQCSRPFQTPLTLPCGNSLCRECLPEAYQRDYVSHPDFPGRRHAITCPFEKCTAEHPVSDCSVDVTLTKVMESISEVVTKHTSVLNTVPTVVEVIARWHSDEAISMDDTLEKPRFHDIFGGRLIGTYSLAAQGKLDYKQDLSYQTDADWRESERALDIHVLQDLTESTHREVDCQVCYNLMLDPVTTFCGHTLCRKCMARVLDHSLHCPVCRRPLAITPSLFRQPSNKALVNLLNGLCPEAVTSRAEVVASEESAGAGDLNVPLFICTLSFPHQPTFLHIFEPRYRLMLRRCIESNREFGMLLYNRYGEPQGELGAVHFYQYGTMLRVTHAQPSHNGTSLVETHGVYRFRVKAHGVFDGYAVGNIERIEDVTSAEEERIEADETALPPAEDNDVQGQIDRMSTQALLALGQEFIVKMQQRSANWLQQRVLNIHGQPPDDAALFPYWFASVLPIGEEEKYKLLPTRTIRERLKITASWIRRIEAQRW